MRAIAAVADPSRLRGKAADTFRRAAHLTHESRMLKSVASDAMEDGLYKAKRAWKRGSRELGNYRHEAEHRVRRQPFRALSVAAGVGMFLGACVAWVARRG